MGGCIFENWGKREGRQLPVLAEQATAPEAATGGSVLNHFVSAPPSAEAPFQIFVGEWSSIIPGIGLGRASLFDDARIKWLRNACGGFAGKNILELGPLEGGHTYMMASAGASQVTSIEANTRAYLKCLIVKETLGFNARFLLGDFREYLRTTQARYDFLLASGVLYHVMDPTALLSSMARVSDRIGIWTHYFDADVVARNDRLRNKFCLEPETREERGIKIVTHRQRYLDALKWSGFCGGTAEESKWLTRESLLNYLAALGFRTSTTMEEQDHENGPCILLYAERAAS